MKKYNKNIDLNAGELFLLAFSGKDPKPAIEMIQEYGLSGLYLSNDNIPNIYSALNLSKIVQKTAKNSGDKLPLLLGVDQEGTWSVMAEDSHPGPGNLALGSAKDIDLTQKRYEDIALELYQSGMNLVFSPCADVNTNPLNAIIGMRSFGTEPKDVGNHVAAAVRGAQSGGVLTTLKHFPGHGDTYIDSHRDLPVVKRSKADVWKIDLTPFREGIKAGVDVVMTSHIIYESLDPDNPATFSKVILQQILRKELGFKGVIISDSMNMHALQKHYKPVDAAIAAISAGVDLIMLAEEHYDHDGDYQKRQRALIEGVTQAIKSGQIPEQRLNSAFKRIRNLRRRLGMKTIKNPRSRDLNYSAQQSAEKALRLLKKHQDWSYPNQGSRLNVVRSSSEEAFSHVIQTRGIGPNPRASSYDFLIDALQNYFEIRIIEQIDNYPDQSEHLVIVLENYTLPGMDFDKSLDQTVLEWAKNFSLGKVTVIALRDSFNLPETGPLTTLCTYSFREESAIAAAKWLAGLVKNIQHGDAFK